MPTWHAPTQKDQSLHHAVGEALKDLDLSGDPNFEDIIGMSTEEILSHALHVVAILGSDADRLQVYVMGLVVGCRYGERRQQQAVES